MTQEEKELLLRDLSARLPYGVKVQAFRRHSEEDPSIISYPYTLDFIMMSIMFKDNIEEYKPYLFPLSSMTEEQALELFELFGINLVDSTDKDYIKINEVTGITFFLQKGFDIETHLDKLIDWLLKNHFDFRGLIPIGLANDATGLNIY